MDKKKKMIIGGVILVAIVAAVGIGMYLRSPQFLAGKGEGNATGKTAITMILMKENAEQARLELKKHGGVLRKLLNNYQAV